MTRADLESMRGNTVENNYHNYVFQRDHFNAQQLKAVEFGSGAVLVLAGAGSGKTRIIAHRIARLVEYGGVQASEIVALSFTNKAANEMRGRIAELIGLQRAKQAILSTFHSLGVRILRRYIDRLGWQKGFAVLDASDQKQILRDVLGELHLGGSHFDLYELMSIISASKAEGVLPSAQLKYRYDPQKRTLDRVYELYQRMRKALGGVDFDDLITLPTQLLMEHEDIRQTYHRRWRYFLVDEYQDTNAAQFRLLVALCGKRPNLMVVGDDDQSIYAFRGADNRHILDFPQQFEDVTLIKLEQNYRSTKSILDAANAVITVNEQRHDKALWCRTEASGEGEAIRVALCRDERAEAVFVVDQIKAMRFALDLQWQDIAILFRTNPQSRPFEEYLNASHIPYHIVGGMKLTERPEVRDLLFTLRCASNARDEMAVRRAINIPKRGVTAKDIEAIAAMATKEGMTFFSAIGVYLKAAHSSPKFEKIGRWYELMRRWQSEVKAGKVSLVVLIKDMIKSLNYEAYLQSSSQRDEVVQYKMRNIGFLFDMLRHYESQNGANLRGFLERMAIEPSQDEKQDNRDKVHLMTLHAAKGLEFALVFMVGCEEGLLPHANSLAQAEGCAEERRLCYVGMTRAKRQLVMTRAAQRQRHGERIDMQASRFLSDIPAELIVAMDAEDSPSLRALQAERKAARRKHLDTLRAQIFGKDE